MIPLPGQVHVVMGGPPCQGVSGLNRHAKRAKIINDPRWVSLQHSSHTFQ